MLLRVFLSCSVLYRVHVKGWISKKTKQKKTKLCWRGCFSPRKSSEGPKKQKLMCISVIYLRHKRHHVALWQKDVSS